MLAEQVASRYDNETRSYMASGMKVFQGIMFADNEKDHVAKLYELMAPAKSAVVVDMGCGVGEVAKLMLEIDPTMKFYCITNSVVQYNLLPDDDRIIGRCMDYHHTSLPDEIADVVMFNESIGFGNLRQLLNEAMRLLKPGGKVFIKDAVSRTDEAVVMDEWGYVFHDRAAMIGVAHDAGFSLSKELLNLQSKTCDETLRSRITPAVWTFKKDDSMLWDSDEWRKVRNEKLLGWMNGNSEAVDCVVGLSTISETWDDLVDKDKEVSAELIDQAFVVTLIDLQCNAFYKQNEALFFAIILAGINAWMDANKLQTSLEKRDRMQGFFIRNLAYEILTLAAFRAGGWNHLRKVSLEMRKFCAHEGYEEWEHRHEA